MTSDAVKYCAAIALRVCRRRGALHLFEDAAQEAMMMFYRKQAEFDPAKGYNEFWCSQHVEYAVSDFIRKETGGRGEYKPRGFVQVEKVRARTYPRAVDHVDCEKLLSVLNARYREVMERLYLRHETPMQIAHDLGVIPCRVQQIRAASLKHMRKAAGIAA
jgi:RNA polymerase sigma factor (sigma-70 family)